MKAIEGKVYAVISDAGVVIQVFGINDIPEWNPTDINVAEVPEGVPVEAGSWAWSQDHGFHESPDEVMPEPVFD
jgi:hypothetical protein